MSKGGFSRSDFLAILAVVSCVLAVAVQARRSAQAAAREKLCVENLHQVARSVLQFAKDHDSRLPGTLPSGAGDPWWWYKDEVKGYLGLAGPSSDEDRVFACPMDRGYSDPGPFWQNSRFNFTSYVFNGVTLPGIPNIAGWPLSAIADPGRTLLVMEWAAHAPLSWHRSRTGRANAPFYTDAECIAAFADGRAEMAKFYYDGYNAAYTRDPIPGYRYRYSGK